MTSSVSTDKGMPPAEVEIDAELVRHLLVSQAPNWANQDIAYLATGWDNEVYRLGAELVVRLPRRELGEAIGLKERRWLPQLAAETGLPIAMPVFVGRPAPQYPFTFSICPYVPGRSAATVDRRRRDGYAGEFAQYLYRLHQPAGASGPHSEFRGVPLAALDKKTRKQISALDPTLHEPALALWEDAVAAAPHEGAPLWLHGDPHPHNTIVNDSANDDATVSLVDFGDLCIGDPASDLGMFWMHFSPAAISEAFDQYGAEPRSSLWRRSRGWGLRYAMLTADLGPDDLLGVIGRETLGILLTDSESAAIAGN
ncbi:MULTISPECIES: aminoglycoside phosphotransferase family protein [unclassified Arthrobacter]|uniref:aminoglycoside phosphotransferase family protein n=2 Tax=Micrococcaceae TaxID=1268 RepID=UPI000CFCBA13|nr:MULTISPECIES: aminoglycoside phosphotransferase family protein [unclassified Arthrobacter]PQZ88266.1 phosphotransferase [Arthrobacter sp. MYb222]PRB76808.1 phosphotransferase [Arthrobacter sp. MYb214]